MRDMATSCFLLRMGPGCMWRMAFTHWDFGKGGEMNGRVVLMKRIVD